MWFRHSLDLFGVLTVGAITAVGGGIKFEKLSEKIDAINIVFDALGLAAFSIAGVVAACLALPESDPILPIVMGVFTGVGGGVLRDVLVNEKRYILTKHIYAVVSVLGSCFYYLLSIYLGYTVLATFFVIIFTVTMRMIAVKYRWKLPKIEFSDK